MFNPFWVVYEIFGKSLRFPENREIMIFNTKVLKITKIMILAEISQNMDDGNSNVIRMTHNITPISKKWSFFEIYAKSTL